MCLVAFAKVTVPSAGLSYDSLYVAVKCAESAISPMRVGTGTLWVYRPVIGFLAYSMTHSSVMFYVAVDNVSLPR